MVISGKVWEKSVGLQGSYGPKQGNPLIFFEIHQSNVIFLSYLLVFDTIEPNRLSRVGYLFMREKNVSF